MLRDDGAMGKKSDHREGGRMTAILSESGWRGTTEVWLDAAYQSLIESGIEAVRIQTLSKKLKLSRSSFYWIFKDREEMLAALLDRWRDKNTGGLIKQSEAYADSFEESLLNVFDCWIDSGLFDSQFEFAVRSWAIQSPEVVADIDAADDRRIEALTKLFLRHDVTPEMADISARVLYQGQIGYISMQTKESLDIRMKKIPLYIQLFTRKPPTQNEINRFYARHNYVVPE
jgi:AcrR family transcriptional regulator